jgi:hypothetical protein
MEQRTIAPECSTQAQIAGVSGSTPRRLFSFALLGAAIDSSGQTLEYLIRFQTWDKFRPSLRGAVCFVVKPTASTEAFCSMDTSQRAEIRGLNEE